MAYRRVIIIAIVQSDSRHIDQEFRLQDLIWLSSVSLFWLSSFFLGGRAKRPLHLRSRKDHAQPASPSHPEAEQWLAEGGHHGWRMTFTAPDRKRQKRRSFVTFGCHFTLPIFTCGTPYESKIAAPSEKTGD
jgi:hypothetical protein